MPEQVKANLSAPLLPIDWQEKLEDSSVGVRADVVDPTSGKASESAVVEEAIFFQNKNCILRNT